MDGPKRVRRKLPQLPPSSNQTPKGTHVQREVTHSEGKPVVSTQPQAETSPGATAITDHKTAHSPLDRISACASFSEAWPLYQKLTSGKSSKMILAKAKKIIQQRLCRELAAQLVEQLESNDPHLLVSLKKRGKQPEGYLQKNWFMVQKLAGRHAYLLDQKPMIDTFTTAIDKSPVKARVRFAATNSIKEIPRFDTKSGATALQTAITPQPEYDEDALTKLALNNPEQYHLEIQECMDLDTLQNLISIFIDDSITNSGQLIAITNDRSYQIHAIKLAEHIFELKAVNSSDDAALQAVKELLDQPEGNLLKMVKDRHSRDIRRVLGSAALTNLSKYIQEDQLRSELQKLHDDPPILGTT